jgi:outer membrane protein OmpA-like peptidoglycan-associated protein/uncharacterized protein YidB (DUF937 family)
MFESLLEEVARKFGLGNKASGILSTLLGLMFNKGSGGMSGFLDKLTRGGLGKIVSSWIGKGDSMPVNSTQLESAMGSDVIGNLASKFGLPSEPVGMAIAHMLPKVVNALTPDGTIPDALPTNLAEYSDDGQSEPQHVTSGAEVGSQYQRDEVVTESEVTRQYQQEAVKEPEVTTQYRQEDYANVSDPDDEGFKFRWWWLLIPLFLLLGWCGLKPASITSPETAVVPDPAPVAPAAPVTKIDPSLSISNEADGFRVSGTVADNATKDSILGMLNSAVGTGKVSGDIIVDPATNSAGWLTKLSGILPVLKYAVGSKLSFDGNNIAVGGNMSQGLLDGLMEKIKNTFGGGDFNISSDAVVLPSADGVVGAAAESVADAADAVANTAESGGNAIQDMVASGTVTGESLVKALNIAGINFDTGSFNIGNKSMAMLQNAAKAINAAPAGTKIHVGGHTDNTGSSQLNTKLSKQRAKAVVDTLVGMGVDVSKLSSQGYGDSQPVADNNTTDGRAQNRRMEFTLQ